MITPAPATAHPDHHAPKAATAAKRSPAATEALATLREAWAPTTGVQLSLRDDANAARATLTLLASGELAWLWWDTALDQPASGPGASPRAPDAMLVASQGSVATRRGLHDRSKASERPLHAIVTNEANLWTPSPGPSQLLLAPWPRLARLATDLEHTADTLVEVQGTTASAGSKALGIALSWDTTTGALLTLERSVPDASLHERAEYAYAATAAGQTAALPTAITLSVLPTEHADAATTQPAPTPPAPTRWTIESAQRGTQAEFASSVAIDLARWNMHRFDPATGKVFDAAGAVVGGELNVSVAGLTDHIEITRASSYNAVAKWGAIACGLLVLGVVVDMIRRRL
jgi:hypothetical protein